MKTKFITLSENGNIKIKGFFIKGKVNSLDEYYKKKYPELYNNGKVIKYKTNYSNISEINKNIVNNQNYITGKYEIGKINSSFDKIEQYMSLFIMLLYIGLISIGIINIYILLLVAFFGIPLGIYIFNNKQYLFILRRIHKYKYIKYDLNGNFFNIIDKKTGKSIKYFYEI